MKRQRIGAIVAISFLLTLLSGCQLIHIKGNTRKPTPYEKVVTTNAVLAETNHGIADAIVKSNQAGLIPGDAAAEATEYQFGIAKYDEELSKILAQGPTVAKANSAQIKGLLDMIRGSATNLLHSRAAGFKNPNSQQDLTTLVNQVLALASALVQDLTDQGVIQ